MRFLFFPGLAAIVTAGGGCTINSPLVCGPPPLVIDRACPALMAPPPQAQPPSPIGPVPKYRPGTPPATEDAGPMLEVLPALPAFVVPRLTPPAPGGARGRTRMAAGGPDR